MKEKPFDFPSQIWFLSFVLATCAGLIFTSFLAEHEEEYVTTETTKIVSLDTKQQSSGRFLFGSGYVDKKLVYAYFVQDNDGGFRYNYIPADQTKMYETDDREPSIEKRSKFKILKQKHKYAFLLGLAPQGTSAYKIPFSERYNMYVPKDSVNKEIGEIKP